MEWLVRAGSLTLPLLASRVMLVLLSPETGRTSLVSVATLELPGDVIGEH
jgi:hypothetical protein